MRHRTACVVRHEQRTKQCTTLLVLRECILLETLINRTFPVISTRPLASALRFVPQNTAQSAKQLNEQAGETTKSHTEHFPTDNTKQLPLATTMVAAAAAVEVDEPETPAVAPKTAQSGEPEMSAMAFAAARPSVTVTPEASVTTSKMACLSVTLTAETTSTASKITRSRVTATPDPPVVRGDASKSSAPAFAGFHTASLVAGPGGVKCLAVRLTVLQKVCPPVHARLKKAVAERCAGVGDSVYNSECIDIF